MNDKRNDEIKEAAKERANQYSHPVQWNDVYNGFISGALWADKHPDAISMNYLQSWLQCSVDETQEPIWTDKHIEELFNDFYLIPKKINDMKANNAPKSKFVYPDKLYARTKNNITLDISYAPQTLEAVEYTHTDAFIKRIHELLLSRIDYITYYHDKTEFVNEIIEDISENIE